MIIMHLTKNKVFEKRAGLEYNVEIVSQLLNHDLITKKYLGNQVTSFGFKKQVFFDNSFDSFTAKARGLFIYDDGQICARSFDKFFNVYLDDKWKTDNDEYEFSDCPLGVLENRLKFPVSIYKKENGYLGILSYNKITDDYFVASKSTTESEFAQWFRDQISYFFSSELKEFLKTENVSLIFEVIDMEHDGSHMIDYGPDCKKLYLIGAVKNDFEGNFYSYDELLKLRRFFTKSEPYSSHEVAIKSWTMNIHTFSHLKSFLEAFENNDEEIEGFVIHDANGFMFKYKTGYYRSWKEARKALELIIQGKNVDPKRYKQQKFVRWALENKGLLKDNGCDTIIKARNFYIEQKGE